MKRLFFVMTLLMVFCTSCEKEGFVQEVRGCVDCVACSGWSWGNGIGSPSSSRGYCQIQVFGDGELKMKYSVAYGGSLYVEGGANFTREHYTTSFEEFTTPVKNSIITFRGRNCQIKDVRIVYASRPTDEDDDF